MSPRRSIIGGPDAFFLGDQTVASATALANLIFVPDFSTKEYVTTISGRGVGMDAVKSYLDSFGCSVSLELLDANEQFAHFQYDIILHRGLFETFVKELKAMGDGSTLQPLEAS